MAPEFYLLIVMVGVFALTVFLGQFPIGVSLMLASIAGTLLAGYGIPLRHLVEGSFAYLDPMLIIASAMIFMEIIRETGALGEISRLIISSLHRRPFWMLALITIFIMFPGMITGLSTAAVLTTGAIVAPALMAMGIPRVKTGSIIAMTAIFGMVAPPINVPAMIIGGGVDMPYIGFGLPLTFASFPIAIAVAQLLGRRHVDPDLARKSLDHIPRLGEGRNRFRLYLPILLLVILMLAARVTPGKYTNLGMPLILLICCAAAIGSGRGFNLLTVTRKAMRNALPVMGILVGIGMFIQIMSLTGVRGYLIVKTLQLPSFWLYIGIMVSLPLFGAISAYGASYVLGVPFLLALLGSNEIVVASGLTLIASLGDMMPPTALAGIFAAQVVDESNYFRILKHCLPYIFMTAVFGIIMILFANQLAKFLVI
ncbi:MAG: TRAP transporter large permease subunit [Fidelibacterota bacterium]|nr:MAG: TRAP transporter large permease subunit [Candidatus Neomarinimicrobiota bacterium]